MAENHLWLRLWQQNTSAHATAMVAIRVVIAVSRMLRLGERVIALGALIGLSAAFP